MRCLSKGMQHFGNHTFMTEFDIFKFSKCNKAVILRILPGFIFTNTHWEIFAYSYKAYRIQLCKVWMSVLTECCSRMKFKIIFIFK